MNTEAIAIDERFTDLELFRMFNVDVDPQIDPRHGEKRRPSNAPYDLDDVKVRLWKFTKRTLSRGERKALQSEDHCTISQHAPGSAGRLADLAAHYQGVDWDTEDGEHKSAFDC